MRVRSAATAEPRPSGVVRLLFAAAAATERWWSQATNARALVAALQRRATDSCAYPHRCTAYAAGLGGETDRQSALRPGYGSQATAEDGSGGFVGL